MSARKPLQSFQLRRRELREQGTATRGALLRDRMVTLRAEIEQIFVDAASWNDNSVARQNGAAAIDIDPDGELRRLANALDQAIANASGQ